jgi:hypothetical protein
MTTDRDSCDEIEEAREYEKKLIDATRFWKSFKTYIEEHGPQVFDEDGEIDRLRLGDYCVDLLIRKFTQRPKLTEFESLVVNLSFTKVPEKCNVCGKQISPTHIPRINELLGPRICDLCILKPGIKEIMKRVDPDETVVFWRDWYRDLSTQERYGTNGQR